MQHEQRQHRQQGAQDVLVAGHGDANPGHKQDGGGGGQAVRLAFINFLLPLFSSLRTLRLCGDILSKSGIISDHDFL